jgi:hypothetical protein
MGKKIWLRDKKKPGTATTDVMNRKITCKSSMQQGSPGCHVTVTQTGLISGSNGVQDLVLQALDDVVGVNPL